MQALRSNESHASLQFPPPAPPCSHRTDSSRGIPHKFHYTVELDDRQPAYELMQALRRSNESHASSCFPPPAPPCSHRMDSSRGIPHKFYYTIELDARGIRRAGKVSLIHIRLQ